MEPRTRWGVGLSVGDLKVGEKVNKVLSKMRFPTEEPKRFSDHKVFLGISTSYLQLAQSDTLECEG